MQNRIASVKETGEELSQAEWERFDAAVAAAKSERRLGARPALDAMRRENAVDRTFNLEETAPARP